MKKEGEKFYQLVVGGPILVVLNCIKKRSEESHGDFDFAFNSVELEHVKFAACSRR